MLSVLGRSPALRRFSSVPVSSLLASLGSMKDVADARGVFGSGDDTRGRVVVKIGGDVVQHEGPVIAEALVTLQRLGLRPVVVHGAGPQLNDTLAAEGVEPQYVGGHRVTDEATLEVATSVFKAVNGQLADLVAAAGGVPKALPVGVFHAVQADPELGLVGKITDVNVSLMEGGDSIPVLSSLGVDTAATDGLLNINADVAARELAVALRASRCVFVSAGGGWKEDGTIVPSLVMARDYDRLASMDYEGRQGTLLKLNEVKAVLDGLPASSTVTICGAKDVVKQLLPHRGPGTQCSTGETFEAVADGEATGALKALAAACGHPEEALLPSTARTVVASAGVDSAVAVEPHPSGGWRLAAMACNDAGVAGNHEEQLWEHLAANFTPLTWHAAGEADAPLSVARSGHRATVTAMTGPSIATCVIRGDRTPLPGAPPAGRPQASRSPPPTHGAEPLKVALLGARGYVARELLRLLDGHGDAQVTLAGSRAFAGQSVTEALGIDAPRAVAPGLTFQQVPPSSLLDGSAPPEVADVDVWVLALPNGHCTEHAAAIDALGGQPTVLDLSADKRFDSSWVYGMPELPGTRAALAGAHLISNPGCYATAAGLGLMPLAGLLAPAIPPHVFGVSGYSGAGTTPSDKNDPTFLADNIVPYSLAGHIHEAEVGRHLGTRVCFSPHVAPFFQGIHATITVHLSDAAAHSAASVMELFAAAYAGEPLVAVQADAPNVKAHGSLSHAVTIGGFTYDSTTGRCSYVAVIDNLLKGAATQALQNINLTRGLPELQGIPIKP